MAVKLAMNSFPPSNGDPVSSSSRSPPLRSTITVNVDLTNSSSSSTGAAAVASSDTTFKPLKLEDFKEFTYRDMSDKSGLIIGAIVDNKQLQSSLQTVLNGSNVRNDISSILQYCNKAGGLLGHRPQYITDAVDLVFTNLNTKSIPQRIKEIQALQLVAESILDFPEDLLSKLMPLDSAQRRKLLRQFHSTPLGISQHSFSDKGAWADPSLRPLLERLNFKLVNNHLQLHQKSKSKKDLIRSCTMVLVSLNTILN